MSSRDVKRTYIYSRSKNIIYENGTSYLSLYAGLVRKTVHNGVSDDVAHVKVLVSDLLEQPVEEASPVYIDLPNGDVRLVINRLECIRLQKLYKTDIESFFTYGS